MAPRTAAPNGRLDIAQFLQCLHRPDGPQLGEEADERVDEQHDSDGAGVDILAERERDGRRRHEQEHDQAPHLVDQNAPCAPLLHLAQLVRAEALPAPGGLLVAQTLG